MILKNKMVECNKKTFIAYILVLFLFSCSEEPVSPSIGYLPECILLEKDKDRAAAHAQKMLPEKLLSLSLSGDDQDIEDAIEEAHKSAYRLYCTNVLVEFNRVGHRRERTGKYIIPKEIEGE